MTTNAAISSHQTTPDVVELGSRIVGLAGRIAAATCRWLLLVADFDAHNGCARWQLASTAQWLTHTCGIAHRTAVDHVRVARALAGFPALADALDAGRISYSHARAIARLAQPGEQRLVADLIEVAENGSVGQLETVVRGMRTVEHNTDPGESGEYVRHGWSGTTSHWRLSARLDPERGALLEHAIDQLAAAEAITRADAFVRLGEIALAALAHSADGPPRTVRGHERAAVLIHLDAAALAASTPQPDGPDQHGEADRQGPADRQGAADRQDGADRSRDTGGSDRSIGPEARSRERAASDEPAPITGPPIDPTTAPPTAPTTATPSTPPRPFARIDNGPGLPRPVVERLLCSCRIRVTVLDRADADAVDPDTSNGTIRGTVLDLGRTRRVVDDRLFRALLLRDRHCAFPGCTSRHKLEAHHVVHWLRGGRTDMANLVLLCVRHHHAHHDAEFDIERVGAPRRGRRGSFVFRRPDGTVLDGHVDPATHVDPGLPPVEAEFPHIPDAALVSKTVGDRLDRAWAVAVLAHRRRTAPGGAQVAA